MLVGCILAATLGVKIYKAIPKYVEAEKLGAYVSQTWAEQGYGSYFENSSTATASDAEDTDSDTSEDTASEADASSETTTTAETDTTEAAE